MKNLVSLKLPLLCNSGLSAAVCACASEPRWLCSHPSGAVLSQSKSSIHCVSPPEQELLPKVLLYTHKTTLKLPGKLHWLNKNALIISSRSYIPEIGFTPVGLILNSVKILCGSTVFKWNLCLRYSVLYSSSRGILQRVGVILLPPFALTEQDAEVDSFYSPVMTSVSWICFRHFRV